MFEKNLSKDLQLHFSPKSIYFVLNYRCEHNYFALPISVRQTRTNLNAKVSWTDEKKRGEGAKSKFED